MSISISSTPTPSSYSVTQAKVSPEKDESASISTQKSSTPESVSPSEKLVREDQRVTQPSNQASLNLEAQLKENITQKNIDSSKVQQGIAESNQKQNQEIQSKKSEAVMAYQDMQVQVREKKQEQEVAQDLPNTSTNAGAKLSIYA